MKAAIIANPISGKDIRRIVAHGSVFDNQEKVRMVRRILVGMKAAGVEEVLYMPEGYGIVPRALFDLDPHEIPASIEPVDVFLHMTQEDTVNSAALMEEAGVAVIVVMGGDGTSRAAASGARNTPILPLSTGTNNVFPVMIEATVAGLAAGVMASGGVSPAEGCYEASILEVLVDDEPRDIALIDVATYNDIFVASRAVWDITRVKQIFLSRCKPDSIGLSAIGGILESITPEEPRGLTITLDPAAPRRVRAPIGPGLFAEAGIGAVADMRPGEIVPVDLSPCILAVDGERELKVLEGQHAGVRISKDRLQVVDVERTMECARRKKLLGLCT
ncbi:MAG: NAD(+)/NADH kinase [Desulfovibrio sp.]|jgi:hypothetical protein|nr:NAD(+)/NADH kinase [Desulfovibrio sp.]